MTPAEAERDPDSRSFLLVRHAESEANAGDNLDRGDSPLSAAGREQADALVGRLARLPIDAVYSSDLVRAMATVTPLARARQLPVVPTPLLREPVTTRRETRFATPEEAAAMLAVVPAMSSEPPLRPETHAELVGRLRRFVELAWPRNDQRCVLVCSHFVTLNFLVRLLTEPGDPPPRLWTTFENAAITRIDFGPSGEPTTGRIQFLISME